MGEGRSGYCDDGGDNENLWRGSVMRALRGKRGQAFLKELIKALDALPEKKLIAHELEDEGSFCAIGAVGRLRGMDMSKMLPENWGALAKEFGIAQAMVREIEYENDEGPWDDNTPEGRFIYVRAWAVKNLISK